MFTNTINYEALFPKVAAVIHHGGSGTTHTALKHACPTMIIPHVIDQFQWNILIHNLGLGPLGSSINKLNKKEFKIAIMDLISNENYKIKAQGISEKIKKEEKENEFMINNLIKIKYIKNG